MTIAEKVEEIRETIELFPRCVKCNGDLRGERISNLIPVIGRDRRYAHHLCPGSDDAAA